MTATPESWDDVGSLRLQVECISKKYGLNDSDLQKLRDKIDEQDQEHKKERRQMRIFVILIAVFLCFVFAVQMEMLYIWGSKSAQKPVEDVWKTYPVNLESLEEKRFNAVTSLSNRTMDETMNPSEEEGKNSTNRIAKEWSNLTKLEVVGQKGQIEEDPNSRDELEFRTAQPETNVSEPGAQRVVESFQRASHVIGESAELAEGNQEKIAPLEGKVPLRSTRGVFYVCFPTSAWNEYVEKWTEVFNTFASSQKWTVYPFCYIDTGNVREMYGEDYLRTLSDSKKTKTWISKVLHLEEFCDDVDQITFVMETSKSNVALTKGPSSGPNDESAAQFEFEHCEVLSMQYPKWFRIGPSRWFRRAFPQGQGIDASSIDEFISDVYSGKIQTARPVKRDL